MSKENNKVKIVIEITTITEDTSDDSIQGAYQAAVYSDGGFTGGQMMSAGLALLQSIANQSGTNVPFILSMLHDMNESTREANNAFKDLGDIGLN
jgi:hypothetical protein